MVDPIANLHSRVRVESVDHVLCMTTYWRMIIKDQITSVPFCPNELNRIC